ncbi:LPXTG cell wall anchor domain-containing protein [Cellulosimicrobium cellulans]|uniref:LPXTG cell wall anchor domain-containing protein n=1 Tax=Cellulosimicrobium cellulans TaxID=1710 RepID=UPI002406C091|nr:LPXTG cell wall anchor domain-containing protein [Cellulosimicrobium cellulans]MDF9877097.1 LPXTG-motif cell wall-anchored protein [Cellulosimicrobium cellulans]
MRRTAVAARPAEAGDDWEYTHRGPTSDAPEPDGTSTQGATPGDDLAATGTDVVVLLALAVVALAVGGTLLGVRRRRG